MARRRLVGRTVELLLKQWAGYRKNEEGHSFLDESEVLTS